MARYSALVKEGNRRQIVANKEYKTKTEFISELRNRGYKVNPKMVKTAEIFDYIMRNTAPWDWSIKEIPQIEEKEVRQ